MPILLDEPTRTLAVHHGQGQPLTALPGPDLFDSLRRHGCVVLRHFRTDLAGFSAFVKQHSSRLSLDPARVFYDAQGRPVAQKVDAGTDAVGLHCENGNSPFWPDLCWFYCERPPSRGSQTTVCDGVQVFDALEPRLRNAFLAQDIVYTRRVPEHLWKTYVRHDTASASAAGPEGADGADIDTDTDTDIDTEKAFRRLLALVNDSRRARVTLLDDGAISYSFQTPAVMCGSAVNPDFRAFANSLFGPSYHYERPALTFADGSPIDPVVLADTARVCEAFTQDVNWQAHDILVIDNRRVMHGRRAIEDTQRSIYNALSYVPETP